MKTSRDFLIGIALWPAALLVHALHRLLSATLRFEILERDRLSDLDTEQALIPCLWHRQLFPAGRFFQNTLRSQGFNVCYMASQSRDGELAARVIRLHGASVVRGSSSRGGLGALRQLHKAVRREAACPVFLADGPKGPACVAKPGAVVLSQLSGAPLLPLAFAVERAWVLKSWDRLLIPKPFSRVVVAIARPQFIPSERSEEQFEASRLNLQRELAELTDRAEAALTVSSD